jgi:ferredoxin-NADP reductase
MSVSIHGLLRDAGGPGRLLAERARRADAADAEPVRRDPIAETARALHPERLFLRVAELRDETPTARSFRFVTADGSPLPPFEAGQYLSFKLSIDGKRLTRPYSISSSPSDARGATGAPYLEVTVRQKRGGYASPWLKENWKVGALVQASGPEGHFFWEPLRDAPRVVAIAGGSGITPFRSMAREIAAGGLDGPWGRAALTILYGSSDERDIIFREELSFLASASSGRLRVVNVLSCDEVHLEGCEKGFITAGLIKKYSDPARDSYFLCGPQAMYRFVGGEIARLGVPARRVRREVFGEAADVSKLPGYPAEAIGKRYAIRVTQGERSWTIEASSGESILVAMERAGLLLDSRCRSGECGLCRSRALSGAYFANPEGDGRRAADREAGFIHPCATYPLSDMEVALPLPRTL